MMWSSAAAVQRQNKPSPHSTFKNMDTFVCGELIKLYDAIWMYCVYPNRSIHTFFGMKKHAKCPFLGESP